MMRGNIIRKPKLYKNSALMLFLDIPENILVNFNHDNISYMYKVIIGKGVSKLFFQFYHFCWENSLSVWHCRKQYHLTAVSRLTSDKGALESYNRSQLSV